MIRSSGKKFESYLSHGKLGPSQPACHLFFSKRLSTQHLEVFWKIHWRWLRRNIHILVLKVEHLTVSSKEYKSLLEPTAPPTSYSGVRTLPTSLRLHWRQLYRRTGSAVYCRQSGDCFPWKTKGGLSVLRVIYILWLVPLINGQWKLHLR